MTLHSSLMIVRRLVALFGVVFGAAAAFGQGDATLLEGAAFRRAQDRVAPSVVRLERIAASAAARGGAASGLIVDAGGLIVASGYHFPEKTAGVVAVLEDGDRYPAEFLARDSACNLVLLRIDADRDLPTARPAAIDAIQPGQWAIAVGRTFDVPVVHGSVGVISATDRIWGRAVQTDASVSPANYGGPLVDAAGDVIGVLTPLSPTAGGPAAGADWYDSGIGFAVPLAPLLARLDRWREDDLKPGRLGVQLGGAALFEPVEIAAVPRGGPAGAAGVLRGDEIVSLDGAAIKSLADLRFALGRRYAGDEATLRVQRGEEELEFRLTLIDELPTEPPPLLGVSPEPGADDAPAVVRYVFPDSPAATAGVSPGDVIESIDGEATDDWNAVRSRLADAPVGQELSLRLIRGEETIETSAVLAEFAAAFPDAPAPLGPAGAAERQVLHPKLPELENQAVAYVPAGYQKDAGYGLLLWFERPERYDADAVVESLQAVCDERRLILLAPEPTAGGVWRRDEISVAWRLAEQVAEQYPVDPTRIAVGGVGPGAGLAYAAALQESRRVATAAAIDGLLPADLEIPAPRPLERCTYLVGWSNDDRRAARFERDFARLRDQRIPTVRLETSPDVQTADVADRLASWLDCMDRL